MKHILNKIYYSLYRIEKILFPYSKKGGYSSGFMINLFTGFEIGVSSLLAGLSTYLLGHCYNIEILTVFTLLVVGYFLLLAYFEKKIWKEPSEEELRMYDNDKTNVFGWFLIGLFMLICSFIFTIVSFLILIQSLG